VGAHPLAGDASALLTFDVMESVTLTATGPTDLRTSGAFFLRRLL
jgi:hypothetical protein